MDEPMNSPYIIKNGLRKVVPYYDVNSTNAKGHWFGRKVIDLLTGEFRTRGLDYYLQQIDKGFVTLNRKGTIISGRPVAETAIEAHDTLITKSHLHEAAVVYHEKIPVIYQDDKIVVINKPSSIPTHPTGRYIKNSISELLKQQENLPNLYPSYRLDKFTSGVLIFSKDSKTTAEVHRKIREKGVTKHYVARVSGKFPDHIICDRDVFNVEPKKGYNAGKGVKRSALTVFERLKYNEELDQSIVLCKPQTGRTHQIRIHLNFLKHPIINDPLYGPNASEIRSKIINSEEVCPKDFELLQEEYKEVFNKLIYESTCDECGYISYKDEPVESLVMWLHALKYATKDNEWSFETELPSWAEI